MRLRLKIGALARERNMSEHDLWKSTGLARNTVRALMRGVNTRVDLVVLEKIAAALGVRPIELFEEVEGQPGQKRPTRKAA